jgi:hypothetical protein
MYMISVIKMLKFRAGHGRDGWIMVPTWPGQKLETLSEEQTRHLPSKCEILNSNPSTKQINKNNKIKIGFEKLKSSPVGSLG